MMVLMMMDNVTLIKVINIFTQIVQNKSATEDEVMNSKFY